MHQTFEVSSDDISPLSWPTLSRLDYCNSTDSIRSKAEDVDERNCSFNNEPRIALPCYLPPPPRPQHSSIHGRVQSNLCTPSSFNGVLFTSPTWFEDPPTGVGQYLARETGCCALGPHARLSHVTACLEQTSARFPRYYRPETVSNIFKRSFLQ